jgi:short-subunit dehydrogenase
MNVVIVARRVPVLEATAGELRARHGVKVRTFAADLGTSDAVEELARATADLEIGLFIYNVGGDVVSAAFLDKDLEASLHLVRRNCNSVLEGAYRFGAPMVARGRGAIILVTSGACWAGGVHPVPYGATKAFDLLLAEGLWAEWHNRGVDVLGLVLSATDTPSFRRVQEEHPWPVDNLADPDDVARTALDHLGDGPTWIWGSDDPTGGPPFESLSRREAVLVMSQGGDRNEKNKPRPARLGDGAN